MNLEQNLSFLFILTTLFLFEIPGYFCQDQQYGTCRRPFQCGNIINITYPFYGADRPASCGYPGFRIECRAEVPLLNISSILYRVLEMDESAYTLRVAREDLWDNNCPQFLRNTTLDFDIFDYSSTSDDRNITLRYNCPDGPERYRYQQFNCQVNGTGRSGYYEIGEASLPGYEFMCDDSVFVPVNRFAATTLEIPGPTSIDVLRGALASGFSIQWSANNSNCEECVGSRGVCGYDEGTASFACYTRTGNGFEGTNRRMLIASLSSVTGIVLIGLSLYIYITRKRKNNLNVNGVLYGGGHHRYPDLPSFDLPTILAATHNFSISNKIGEGGFGSVYKGMLEGGQEIAVKRLSKHSTQGLSEFKTEVILIAKLQHRNLVRLLGCCVHGEESMLVYEYMPNKSLDFLLFDQTKRMLLDWPKRFTIINGTARGLLYLHQDSRLRIIHRDLKASNVLLDSEMNPKISDFGLARSFVGNETEAKTRRVVGTYGYMSPEYAVDGLFSVKSDVFSFGVLILEIISGEKNRLFAHNDHSFNLLGHAWTLYNERRSLELMEACLADSFYFAEVERSIHVGLLCVQQNPEDRPDMSSVVQMLSNENLKLPKVKQPGFFTEREVFTVTSSTSIDANCSINEMTITMPQGR